MNVLGIETSCDETAAAVLEDNILKSNIIFSQSDLHSKYGGVVPEIASRNHLDKISLVIEESLKQAGVSIKKIDLVGVTCGPGLMGPLLVGLSAAKAIAWGLDVPFVGINHLEGHIFAHFIENPNEGPPFLALIASGGHTSLVYVQEYGKYEVLGETRDDACGEAFDKVGKLIGLEYPAGALIEKLAAKGEPNIKFPRPLLDGYDFSFAGLKTAVVYYLKRHPITKIKKEDIAASFQQAVVDVLVKKTLSAASSKGVKKVVVVGGVAANSELRRRFREEGSKLRIFFPSKELCTDNAAMIAAAASYRYRQGKTDGLDLVPSPSLIFSAFNK
jgi:N6-L-threonylcarbamoyladenine synthase